MRSIPSSRSWRAPARWPEFRFAWLLLFAFQASVSTADWVRFRQETSGRLIAPADLGSADPAQKAYAWGDVDGDGDIDLICVRKVAWTSTSLRRNVLFLNQGIRDGRATDGVLVEAATALASLATNPTQSMGMLDATNDRGVLLVDVDGDGWLDVVTATTLSDGQPKIVSHPRIYRNMGRDFNGTWLGFIYEPTRIPQLSSIPAEVRGAPRFSSVAAGDVNGDGFPDLYFSSDDTGPGPSPDMDDRLLINDGTGFFTDSRDLRAPLAVRQSLMNPSAALVDLNRDLRPDIIKVERRSTQPAVKTALNGDLAGNAGSFDSLLVLAFQLPTEFTTADLNLDGFMDLVISDDGYDNYLLQRPPATDGRPVFRSGFLLADRFSNAGPSGNSIVADLDGDGWPDVIVTDVDSTIPGCSRRTRFYRNLGSGFNVRFQEQGSILPNPVGIHDIAVFDLNGDGHLDLIVGKCTGTEIWIQEPRNASIQFFYPAGRPALLRPSQPTPFRVGATNLKGEVPTQMNLHVGRGGLPLNALPLQTVGPGVFAGSFPVFACGDTVHWYVSATFRNEGTAYDPPNALVTPFVAQVHAEPMPHIYTGFETADEGWTVANENLQSGAWERADPIESIHSNRVATPEDDAGRDPDRFAYVTGVGTRGAPTSSHDVDGGPTYLVSPSFDVMDSDAVISFAYWVYCDDRFTFDEDTLNVDFSHNGGEWIRALTLRDTNSAWSHTSFRVGSFGPIGGTIRVRFGIADLGSSVTEAAVDEFRILRLPCTPAAPSIFDSFPSTGSIDARQPADPAIGVPQGWQSVRILFDPDASNVRAEDLELFDSSGTPLSIAQISMISTETVDVQLSRPMTAGAWLEITHSESDTVVRLGFLPGDVNANGITEHADLEAWISVVLGEAGLIDSWRLDIDRSGQLTLLDLLRLIDVFNGAGAIEPWMGRSLP